MMRKRDLLCSAACGKVLTGGWVISETNTTEIPDPVPRAPAAPEMAM